MSMRENLIQARSSLIFLFGLVVGFGCIISLEIWNLEAKADERQDDIISTSSIPVRVPGTLTEKELQLGSIAWQYFENNLQTKTGLVNSVDKYPAATMWDTASYLLAAISAERLGILPTETFDKRVTHLLHSLASLPLFDNTLPNKSYNTQSLHMVDYANHQSDRGIGWSAIDIARIMVPLTIIVWNHPHHAEEAKAVLDHWNLKHLFKNGVLYGAMVDKKNKTVFVQEGRLGYEEYAAKALTLSGYEASEANRYLDFTQYVNIYGVKVPTDTRDPKKLKAHTYVLSEPYILDGLEFGWDRISKEFSSRIYEAQRHRFQATGVLTAVTEDNLDQAPYFAYNTVYSDGQEWATLSPDGQAIPHLRSFSTKAAFGWYALYADEYSTALFQGARDLYDPKRGWFSGVYEDNKKTNTAITANGNGIILESLYYKKYGPLMRITRNPSQEVGKESGSL